MNIMDIVSNIIFKSSENAVLLKITLMLAAALGCTVAPYHILELPSKKPMHPYVSDVVIKG